MAWNQKLTHEVRKPISIQMPRRKVQDKSAGMTLIFYSILDSGKDSALLRFARVDKVMPFRLFRMNKFAIYLDLEVTRLFGVFGFRKHDFRLWKHGCRKIFLDQISGLFCVLNIFWA